MPGAVNQITALGPHDDLLTKDGDFSFFESSTVTYEHFAIESIEQSYNGTANFGNKVSFELQKTADAVCGACLEVTLPALTTNSSMKISGGGAAATVGWMHKPGIYIITKLTHLIGGQVVETQYPQFVDIYTRLTTVAHKQAGFNDMIGQFNIYNSVDSDGVVTTSVGDSLQVLATSKESYKLLIPLYLWWCIDFANALPIGCLLFNPVRIEIEFRAANDCIVFGTNTAAYGTGSVTIGTPTLGDTRLYVDYVFLSKQARDRYAGAEHFYVVPQTQFSNAESVNASSAKIKLSFNMPLTQILFVVQEDAAAAAKRYDFFDQWDSNDDKVPRSPLVDGVLQTSGQDRFTVRTWQYWSRWMPYRYQTAIPESRGIFDWCAGLYPESSQPSGTFNFSRVDNPTLVLNFAQISNVITGKVYPFARNVNFFKVKNGYGGMFFAN